MKIERKVHYALKCLIVASCGEKVVVFCTDVEAWKRHAGLAYAVSGINIPLKFLMKNITFNPPGDGAKLFSVHSGDGSKLFGV